MTNKTTKVKAPLTLPDNIGVALVLGTGGVRAAAHIGIIEVLEQNGIPIDLMVCSGSGSIVGAMYAYYKSSKIVLDKLGSASLADFLDINWYNYIRLFYSGKGLCDGKNFQRMLIHQLPNCRLQDLKKKIILVATDINTLTPVELTTGKVIDSVLASSALAPFFSPVTVDGKLYLDGGISSPIPTDVAKKYNSKLIIAADLSQHDSAHSTRNMLQITYRSLEIANLHLAKFQRKFADIVINPKIPHRDLASTKIYDLYLDGRKEALKMLPAIKMAVQNLGLKIEVPKPIAKKTGEQQVNKT